MYKSIAEVIAESKEKDANNRAELEPLIGDYCNALRAFVDTALEWQGAADEAFALDLDQIVSDWLVTRVISLQLLTTKALETARDIAGLLQIGATTPALVSWRTLSETKNAASIISLDVSGKAGFLWFHYGFINRAKFLENDGTAREAVDIAKSILAEAGFKYDSSKRNSWALGLDGKTYSNAVDRCGYVWKNRPYPIEVDEEIRSFLETAEVDMIRQSNAVAHPTMDRSALNYDPHPLMIASLLEPMGVMLAYKEAASDLKGWLLTPTVGERFLLYPPKYTRAQTLSAMVMKLYFHCSELYRQRFLEGMNQQ